MKTLSKVYRWLLYLMPVALGFSYWPVMRLGESESMYFELSVAVVWLVVFDVVAVILMIRRFRGELARMIFGAWKWLILPIFVTASVFWSLNMVRGVLTAGMMWAIVVAIFAFWNLRDELDASARKIWWRWFFGAAVVMCVWCAVQCVMDVMGVSCEVTGMCAGCNYVMFGFPRPNGWAIEPQFMGNLLLAPTIVSAYCLGGSGNDSRGRVASARRHGRSALILGRNSREPLEPLPAAALLCIFSATIFLTLSRGAIYAMVVGLLVMTVVAVVQSRSWRALWIWPVVVVAFGFTLNLQGVLAEASPTSEGYFEGVARVVNQLSLGVIDVRDKSAPVNSVVVDGATADETAVDVLANNVMADETAVNESEGAAAPESVFDGYVAESTDTRMRLTGAAVTVWKRDFATVMFGVGIGGAGTVLYDAGLSPAPREIVQNEYASLLLETGVVGLALFVIMIVMFVVMAIRRGGSFGTAILALVVSYLVTLVFFSGLPNALQVYLMPAALVVMFRGYTKIRA